MKAVASKVRENLVEACARAAHESNRAYCIAIGDDSQPSWERAPDWQRSSAINGVASALAGNTPEQLHESWLAEKVATGWKHGQFKDPDLKEHPCKQRAKDALFLAVVRAMAEALK